MPTTCRRHTGNSLPSTANPWWTRRRAQARSEGTRHAEHTQARHTRRIRSAVRRLLRNGARRTGRSPLGRLRTHPCTHARARSVSRQTQARRADTGGTATQTDARVRAERARRTRGARSRSVCAPICAFMASFADIVLAAALARGLLLTALSVPSRSPLCRSLHRCPKKAPMDSHALSYERGKLNQDKRREARVEREKGARAGHDSGGCGRG